MALNGFVNEDGCPICGYHKCNCNIQPLPPLTLAQVYELTRKYIHNVLGMANVEVDMVDANGEHKIIIDKYLEVEWIEGDPMTDEKDKWYVTSVQDVPGQWNPYDGGTPPDVDIEEIGDNVNPLVAVRLAIEAMLKERMNWVWDCMGADEMEREQEHYRA